MKGFLIKKKPPVFPELGVYGCVNDCEEVAFFAYKIARSNKDRKNRLRGFEQKYLKGNERFYEFERVHEIDMLK